MAPWAVGLGMLVSFTASAGTDTSLGSSVLVLRSTRLVPPLPPGSVLIGATSSEPNVASANEALHFGWKIDPDTDASAFPRPRREGKGDDSLYPEPSFARRGRVVHNDALSLLSEAVSGRVAPVLVPGSANWNHDEIWDPGFVANADLGRVPALGANPPADAILDGSTPAIPRAIALSSTTPAPADATPVEIASASLGFPRTSSLPEIEQTVPDNARHRYADLIVPDALDKEQRCLAEAVYFEARSEPEEGQAAVAQVVLNRVKSGLYPTNVCGVVYQNRHRYMGCQFSFACEGKSLRIADGPSWQSASRIAKEVIEGRTYLSEVGGATHYHADYVKPGWSRRLKKMDVIGRHIFYSLKRGQT